MNRQEIKGVSFDDPNGARVSVPAEQLSLYSTIKSDQLAVLNRIIADHTAGFTVEINENMITSLAGLAGELAYACNEFMCALSATIYVPPEARILKTEAQ